MNQYETIFLKNFFSSFYLREKVSQIKTWKDITNFFSCQIVTCFSNLHLNRLKNIFFSCLGDSFLWREIEKLFNFNLLSFSFDAICENKSILKNNFLALILFEMYLFEFDIFLSYLSFTFSSAKNVPFRVCNNPFINDNYYFSLRLESKLNDFQTSSILNYSLFKFENPYSVANYSLFVKRFFNCRYKFHLLLGFTSSRKFSFFLKSKLIAFLRTVLYFDLQRVTFSSKEIFFIGFCINSFFSKVLQDDFVKPSILNKKIVLTEKLYLRLKAIKKKFLNSFLSRVRYELIINFLKRNDYLRFSKTNKSDSSFWSFFFQLESSRCFRYYFLIFSDDVSSRWFN